MIEIIENKESTNPKSKYRLVIDGEIINAKVRNFDRDGKFLINISAVKLAATETIFKHKFREFPGSLSSLHAAKNSWH